MPVPLTVRIQSNGTISQTAAGIITANELGLHQQAASGNIRLAAQNDVNVLSARNEAAGGASHFCR